MKPVIFNLNKKLDQDQMTKVLVILGRMRLLLGFRSPVYILGT